MGLHQTGVTAVHADTTVKRCNHTVRFVRRPIFEKAGRKICYQSLAEDKGKLAKHDRRSAPRHGQAVHHADRPERARAFVHCYRKELTCSGWKNCVGERGANKLTLKMHRRKGTASNL